MDGQDGNKKEQTVDHKDMEMTMLNSEKKKSEKV